MVFPLDIKHKFEILQELKDLIPPLSENEFSQLEQNCIRDGILYPFDIAEYPDDNGEANRVLCDGHNRYEIAQKNGLEYNTELRVFKSLDDVKIWMIDKQKGRRNLSDWTKYELAQVKAEILREKGRRKMSEARAVAWATEKEGLSIVDKPTPEPTHNTREEIASDIGFSTGKVAMADKVKKHIEENKDEELKEKLRNNEVSINRAYQELRKAEKLKEREEYIEQQKRDIAESNLPEIKDSFDLLVFDPPWPYGRKYDPETSRVANPYPEMSIPEIKAINVPSKDSSIMFLWTTHQFLPDAFDILKDWGYDYKATMVWNKEKIGMGYWLRMQCEFCLLAVKGKPVWDVNNWRDIFSEPRREHSRKPDAFYEKINEYFPYMSKLEYFSREQREGWEVFGNEIDKF